jgi:hypothetical protein
VAEAEEGPDPEEESGVAEVCELECGITAVDVLVRLAEDVDAVLDFRVLNVVEALPLVVVVGCDTMMVDEPTVTTVLVTLVT